MLPPEAIKELKAIHKEESNEEISDEEALEMGLRLINLFRVIYQPIPGENNEFKKSKKERVN